MASIVLFSCLAMLLATVSAGDLLHGDVQGGELVYYKTHVKSPEPFVVDEEIVYVGVGSNGVIKLVRAQDIQGDGTSSLLSGGAGEKEVEIKLVGERGKGYEFLVEVYAEYD